MARTTITKYECDICDNVSDGLPWVDGVLVVMQYRMLDKEVTIYNDDNALEVCSPACTLEAVVRTINSPLWQGKVDGSRVIRIVIEKLSDSKD